MSAYNDLLNHSSGAKLKEYRQSLVSDRSRGNLISGNLADSMDAMEKPVRTGSEESAIAKIFIRTGRVSDPGFIFDVRGTEKILRIIEANGKIKLSDDMAPYLLFNKTTTAKKWTDSTDAVKRKAISRNTEELIKKTEINYRTHGDRLHYYVVGRVTVTESGKEKSYPLFLFACNEVNKRSLYVDVESTGFVNFWLDKQILQDEIARMIKGYEITIDDTFASKMNDVSQLIKTIQPSSYDSITFDPNYSAVCIITGFEPEFIDPVWQKILEVA